PEIEIRLTPQLLIEQLQLMACREDGSRSRCCPRTVAHGRFQPERDDDGARLVWPVRVCSVRLEKGLAGREVIEPARTKIRHVSVCRPLQRKPLFPRGKEGHEHSALKS